MTVQPGCDPTDLDCYQTDVEQSDPVSVMGDWVPDWWVAMSAVVAGIAAAVIACVLILVWARLHASPRNGFRLSTRGAASRGANAQGGRFNARKCASPSVFSAAAKATPRQIAREGFRPESREGGRSIR